MPRVGDGGLVLGDGGALQVGVEREQRRPASTAEPSRTGSVSMRPISSGLTNIRSASTQPWNSLAAAPLMQ